MHVADIAGSGKAVTYEDGRFAIQDQGPVSVDVILEYDQRGAIEWLSDDLCQVAHALSAGLSPTAPGTADAPETSSPGWAGRHKTLPLALGVAASVVILVAVGAVWFITVQASQARHPVAASRETARVTPLGRALDQVGAIDAALRIGVNFQGFSARLETAAAAVEAFRPTDSAGAAIKKSLDKVLLYHRAASEAWEKDLASEWWSGQDKPAYWKRRYPALDLSAAGARLSPDQVRQAAWVVAGTAYADAKRAAAAYGK